MPTPAPAHNPTTGQAIQEAGEAVSGSLKLSRGLVGILSVLVLGGGTGAAYHVTAKANQTLAVVEQEAIATKQAKAAASEVLAAHQRWLDERLAGIERQLTSAATNQERRADQIDRRIDTLESELRLLRDKTGNKGTP
jgi:polyhydroxyalkanoate synthesis regulator phasin